MRANVLLFYHSMYKVLQSDKNCISFLKEHFIPTKKYSMIRIPLPSDIWLIDQLMLEVREIEHICYSVLNAPLAPHQEARILYHRVYYILEYQVVHFHGKLI